MAYSGVALVEVPIVAGKLQEAGALFIQHEMGLAYTASQPGFVGMDIALDAEKHSVVIMEKWAKKEDWQAYVAKRDVENEGNAAWNAAFGPLVGGAPRMVSLDSLKSYAGTETLAEGASCGVALVEVPIVAGKLEEAGALFTQHEMGLAYTASQPGFIGMDIALDAEKHSVVIMEKWTKKEDWQAYVAKRDVENEGNAAWNAAFGPLVGGAPRMVSLDSLKTYKA
jgi:heme-degrading monooxygenase HmoA